MEGLNYVYQRRDQNQDQNPCCLNFIDSTEKGCFFNLKGFHMNKSYPTQEVHWVSGCLSVWLDLFW